MASIFLSHSSQDNEVALDLSCRLKEHGYDSLFLDFDPESGIRAGRDWERELVPKPETCEGRHRSTLLWDVDLESWQRRAGVIANRNFSRKEWRVYFPDTPYRKTFPDLPLPPEPAPK